MKHLPRRLLYLLLLIGAGVALAIAAVVVLLEPSPQEAVFQRPRLDPAGVDGYRFCELTVHLLRGQGITALARTGPTPPDGDVRPVLVLVVDVPEGGNVADRVPGERAYEIPIGVFGTDESGPEFLVPSSVVIDAYIQAT